MNFISEKDIGSLGDSEEGDASKKDEPIDNRPLYHRLKEVRDKKQLEHDEAHKFKNQFRGIDEDEADFLRMVDVSKSEAESRLKREEDELIRNTIASAPQTAPADPQPVSIRPKAPATKAVNKQASLLAGAIRKRPHPEQEKPSSNASASAVAEPSHVQPKVACVDDNRQTPVAPPAQSLCRVIGVLPGLTSYQDSSDSDSDRSSDSEDGGAEFSISSLAQKSAGDQQTGQPAAGGGGCRRA